MIELENVILRPFEPFDVEQLYSYRNDWEVIRLLGGFSAGYSRNMLDGWIERHQNRDDETLWCIADKLTDRCIGHVGLYRIDLRSRKADFGIIIGDKEWRGRGVGHAVTDRVLRFGFEELSLHKITLGVLDTNPRAIKLYEKIGFVREGKLRDEMFREGVYVDMILMSIIHQEWRQRQVRGEG